MTPLLFVYEGWLIFSSLGCKPCHLGYSSFTLSTTLSGLSLTAILTTTDSLIVSGLLLLADTTIAYSWAPGATKLRLMRFLMMLMM